MKKAACQLGLCVVLLSGMVSFAAVPARSKGRVVHARHANTEGAVAFLPVEGRQIRKSLVEPFGRIAFEELNTLRNGHSRGNRDQHMHMVLDPTDAQRPHAAFSSDAAKIWPKPLLQTGFNPGAPLVRSPDTMDETTCKGMHEDFLPSLRDSWINWCTGPSDKSLGYCLSPWRAGKPAAKRSQSELAP